ncbi:MAG TPA: hypothetical protein EYQ78_07720 [Candidatus Poseidoniales archaeon]|nr:hypothetical protein [Candidatus Poseidoniales archaeon]
MATVNLGKIKPTWRNAWASGTAYTVDDMVSHGGTSYMCISNVSGTTTPNADTSNWDSMAVKGDIGVTGAQGTTGNTGSQGPIGNTGPSGFPSGGTAGQVVTNTSSGIGTWQDVAAGGKLIGHAKSVNLSFSSTSSILVKALTFSYTPVSSSSTIVCRWSGNLDKDNNTQSGVRVQLKRRNSDDTANIDLTGEYWINYFSGTGIRHIMGVSIIGSSIGHTAGHNHQFQIWARENSGQAFIMGHDYMCCDIMEIE